MTGQSSRRALTEASQVTMDALENLVSTAEPAFACDRKGSIVAWNEAAERLFGHAATDVIGKQCYEVLDGRDVFGNRFCDKRCAVRNMIHRHEPVHHCQLSYCTSSSLRVDVAVSVFVVFGAGRSEQNVVHVLEPVKSAENVTLADFQTRSGPIESSGKLAKTESPTNLTSRETEVLRLLATGSNTLEVAERLCISEATVRNHVRNILNKLEVHSRLEAVCLAIDRGLL